MLNMKLITEYMENIIAVYIVICILYLYYIFKNRKEIVGREALCKNSILYIGIGVQIWGILVFICKGEEFLDAFSVISVYIALIILCSMAAIGVRSSFFLCLSICIAFMCVVITILEWGEIGKFERFALIVFGAIGASLNIIGAIFSILVTNEG